MMMMMMSDSTSTSTATEPTINEVVIVCASTNSNVDVIHPTPHILTKFHAGYFFISLSFAAQALLWKSLSEHKKEYSNYKSLWHGFNMVPSFAYLLLWCLAALTGTTLSLVYMLKSILHFDMVKEEFSHHIGFNYMYAPWISWLLMLHSSPNHLVPRNNYYYQLLCLGFSLVILLLDVKLYGQWFTTEKRFLSVVANPVSLVSVIGNLVAAKVVTEIGWKESGISLFSVGMVHYLILFVTLYQRLTSSKQLPTVLRPAYFLFFGAPSMASIAWKSIGGGSEAFSISSKMLFFLSLFLFISQACRAAMFKKTMKKLNVTWWVYSFPLTFQGLACAEYAEDLIKHDDTISINMAASFLMLAISIVSVLVFIFLMLITVLQFEKLFTHKNATSSDNQTKST